MVKWMFYKNRYSIVFFLLVSGLNLELLQANGKIVKSGFPYDENFVSKLA